MQTKPICWTRRILVCVTVLCLMATGLDVKPAQASPPAGDFKTSITFISVPGPKDLICIGKLVELVIGVKETYERDPKDARDAQLAPLCDPANPSCRLPEDHGPEFKGGVIGARAELGTIKPEKYDLPPMWAGREVGSSFYYVATKAGHETLTFWTLVPNGGLPIEEKLHFDVKKSCEYNVRGSVDITRIASGMSMEGWQLVGSYDVVGTIKVHDDGSITGQGTANLFEDALFTGGDDDITCDHMNPWQGTATVELEADPNAWADENTLVLTLSLDSMQVNTTQVECEGPDDSYGYGNSPPVTIASFDLNFEPISSDGGSTNLNFQFPAGPGQYEMELIVTPAEAES